MFTKTTLTGLRSRLCARSTAALVALLMVVSLTVASAPSASAAATGYGSYIGGNWWGTWVANGVKVACIDPRKAPPAGNPYTSSTASGNTAASAYLLWNYLNVADNETGSLLSYMIQSATDLPHSGKGGNVPEFISEPSNGHTNKWRSMKLDMDRNKGPYKVRITVTQNPTATNPTGQATAELLSAAGNRQPVAGNPNITINLTSTSAVTNMATSVTLGANAQIATFNFTMPATSTSGTITGTSTTAPPTAVTILTASDPSYQRMAMVPPNAVSTAAGDSDPASRPASPNGNMQAQMLDANNTAAGVAGADIHFQTYPGGRTVASLISGSNGMTSAISLPIGQYTANEVSAPTGFNPDAGTSPVVTVTSGGTVTAKLYNSEQGKVSIHKQDAQAIGTSLAGAKFRVTNIKGQTLVDLVTGAGGNVTSAYLPAGTKVGQTVRITELSAPAGYIKSPTVNQVVTRTGTSISNVGDNQMGKVSVHLTDGQTQAGIAGATFQVSNGSTKFGQPGKTNANGDWTFPAYLPYRVGTTFRISQTITPAGYVNNNGAGMNVQLTRAGDGAGRWTLVNNEQGRVSVHKTDTSTGRPLSGAVFRVISGIGASIKTLATGTTDKNGDWLSPQLTTTAVGATGIQVDEVTAPPGFTRTAPVAVSPTRSGYTTPTGKTPLVTLADSRVFGKVTIVKKDTVTKQAVAGVTFTATVSKIGANGNLGAPVAIKGPATVGTESPAGSGRYVTNAVGQLTVDGAASTPQLAYGDKVTFTEVSTAAQYVQPVTPYTVTGTIGPNAVLTLSAFNSPKRSVQIIDTDLITKQQIPTPTGAGFTICYTPKAGRPTSAAERAAAIPCTVPTGTGLTDTTTRAKVDPRTMILIDTVTSAGGKTPVSTPSGFAQSGDPVTIFQTSPPGGYVPGTTVARTTITDTGWATACSNTTAGGTGGTGVVISCNFVDQPIPAANITKRIVEWGTATTAAGYSPSGAHYLVKDVTTGTVVMSDAGPTDAAGKLSVQLPGVNLGDQISFTEITAPTGTTLDSTPILGTVKSTPAGVGVWLSQDDMTNDPCGSTAWNYKVLDQPVVTGTVTPLSTTDAAMTPGSNVFALRSAGSATSTPVTPAFVLTWPAVGQALTYTVTRTPGDGSAGGTKTYAVSGTDAAPDANGNVNFTWSGDATGAVDGWQSDYLWTVTANNSSAGSPISAAVHLTSQAQAPTNATVATAKTAQTATTPAVLSNTISWGPPASAAGATPDGFHGADIVGYTVWLATAAGGWTAVGTTAPLNAAAAVNNGGTFTDRGVPAGSTRQYAVTARVAMGDGESSADQALLSPFSATVSAIQFAAPVRITASSAAGTTTVSWPALTAGQSLNIVRWQLTACPAAVPDRSLMRPDPTAPNDPTKAQYGCLIQSGLTTSPYIIAGEPAGADLIYTTTITDAAGDSPAGNDAHVAQAPPAPNAQACASAANLGGAACPGGAPGTNIITWNFPYDANYKANNQLDQRAAFQIYRSLSTDVASAAPAVDMTAPVLQSLDPTAANYFSPTVIAPATSTTTVTMSTVDLNRELGSNYDYAVVACNQNVQTLAWQCGAPNGTNVVPQYPATPVNIVGDMQTPNVSDTLTWDPVPGATGYNVYRSDNLASCLSTNLTSVEENSLTIRLGSTGAVAINPAPLTATMLSNIAAPQASCYAFSVQAVNATGAGPRSSLDAQDTQASYIVQYPPTPCLNPAGSLPGANNTSTTSFLAGAPADPTTCAAEINAPGTTPTDQFGPRPARSLYTRAANIEVYRRVGNQGGADHPWNIVSIWHNTTGLENQTSVSVNDPTGTPGIEYQYFTNVCSESLNTGASQCTSSPVAAGQLDNTVITQP